MTKKTVLITGAGSGLGACLSRAYTKQGFQVIGVDVNEAGLNKVAQECGLLPIAFDISKSAAWESHAAAIAAACNGSLDVCVANAGVLRDGAAEDFPEAMWDLTVNANFTGAFFTMKYTLELLKKAKGNVVIIGSSAASVAGEKKVGYISTKHGLVGLMRSIAIDYGPDGIRANMISPGWMKTEMADKEMEVVMQKRNCSLEEAYAFGCEYVPLKRPGLPDEIAEAVLFVSSDKASFISGSNIVVDGGAAVVDSGMINMNKVL